jgi:carbonic anhydrase
MRTLDKQLQDSITPALALKLLKDGNERFIKNLKFNRNLLQQVNETSGNQFPFAVILSCIDSRTSAELIFDQGLGDIFSVRIAGNIINDDILGSLEFACAVAGAKLILILGHSKCGAIKGACDHIEMGHLSGLLKKITPAVEIEKSVLSDRNSSNSVFVEKVAVLNVSNSVRAVLDQSPILRELINKGNVGIVGAMYDVESGKVQFYGELLA